jgi:Tat protein secretion system quality control protein TatD with DNase activity
MKCHQSLKFLPFNKLFLETDDQNNYNIFEAYELMAKVKGISLANLENQLYLNYKDCFL